MLHVYLLRMIVYMIEISATNQRGVTSSQINHPQEKKPFDVRYLIDYLQYNVMQDSEVNNDVLLDDDSLVMITKNDRVKAISINTATVVTVFEGFASSSMNSICLLNSGKGKMKF